MTPLGSHDGEFCRFDRAILFEDPDGTRLLYDAGRMAAGADDQRLGKDDEELVNHIHGDHVGEPLPPDHMKLPMSSISLFDRHRSLPPMRMKQRPIRINPSPVPGRQVLSTQ
ncbi:MAG: hypothetical protein AB2603_02740 [Candidatus Thiodiazotropha endolucinida]